MMKLPARGRGPLREKRDNLERFWKALQAITDLSPLAMRLSKYSQACG